MAAEGSHVVIFLKINIVLTNSVMGAQWLSGRVLDSRLKGQGFEPHGSHCVVSLSKNINPSLVLVQQKKTHPFITERLLMGHKKSNQMDEMLHNVVSYLGPDCLP